MKTKCAHCDEPAITNLDGDDLCQIHANEWARGEGNAAREAEVAEAEYRDCGGEGWFKTDDGALAVCYGNKCH